MASRAVVITVEPLTVKVITTEVTMPGVLLMTTAYEPAAGDIVTCLLMKNETALVLGIYS